MSALCLLQTGFLTLALSLFSTVASASDAEIVSFEAELLPILKARCAVCHMTGQEPGAMALTPDKAWSALVAQSCLLYTSPSPRDRSLSRMPSSA